MSGMLDKSIFHIASIFVVVLLSEDGLNVSTLFPTTGPSVIFVSTTNCSGFTVTNWWVAADLLAALPLFQLHYLSRLYFL
jgi:hypothetical protein